MSSDSPDTARSRRIGVCDGAAAFRATLKGTDMRFKAVILSALLCGSATATTPPSQPFAWRAINADVDYVIDSSGNPLTDDDAQIHVRTRSDVGEKSGGALGAVDAAAFRNGRVVLSAELQADPGIRDAAIWLRVDGDSGKLFLANSGNYPITGGQPPAYRVLGMNVPAQARRIVYGVMYTGSGAIRANAIRLRAAPATADEAVSDMTEAAQVTAREVLDAAIALVQTHALEADAIDWHEVPARLRESVSRTDDRAQAHAAVRELLALLGDNHSFLMPATGAAQQPARSAPAATPAIPSASVAQQPTRSTPAAAPVVKQLTDGIGYVQIPAFTRLDANASRRFAAAVVADIKRVAGSIRHGWIVDLRHNSGGNMWPMLAALEPLLGAGALGSFQDRHGRVQPWRQAGTEPISPGAPNLQKARVAVLIGARTSSSGEILAVAFRGRPDTRSFGQTTSGRTSSNRVFPLPDGSHIALTTSRILDRQGKVMPDHLEPDETTPADGSGGADPTLAAATAWLARR